MKSSPKMNEMPASTGSKTPASGKKLVQARLPFKTLGGSEPPFTTSNDTADVVLVSANTLTPDNNRKRKQSATITKDDGIRAPKINRCVLDSTNEVRLESSETMESDLSSGETETVNKKTLGNNSESKENVCVDKCEADDEILNDTRKETVDKADRASSTPKAKQSLEFDEERSKPRKSKRHEASIPKIKLPISKKSKKNKKLKKSLLSTSSSAEASMEEEDQPEEDAAMDVDAVENVESTTDSDSESMEHDDAADNNDSSNVADKSFLNDSILSNASDLPTTPGNCKMTPKQLQRRLESEKKKQEKERAKVERERALQEEKESRQREKEERELQKKREREEKEEQRKKEKEKLLEEKQREKEQKEQQRKMEREEKEEQKKREKEEKELQKKKEREEKEREKEEERKKREEEKQKKMEAEQNKNRKTAEAFAKFFVPKKVDNKMETSDNDDKMDTDQAQHSNFISFQIKADMKLAPVTRRTINGDERSNLEELIASNTSKRDLYVSELKSHTIVPRKSTRTWLDDEECSTDELFIIGEIDSQGVQVMQDEPKKLYRAKFFKFSENRRPAFYGTWRKRSQTVRPRKPFGKDSRLDYEVDSDDEWEEEEPGESLHGSDDEKEAESEDEYEIDNEFFVPHGHLSDEELQNEDETENDPENLKVKLKIAQNEFDDERKKKTHKLKPCLIGLIWQKSDGSKPENCSNRVWEIMNKHAMLFNGPSVKVERPNNQQQADDDDENHNKTMGVRRLNIGEKEIPDLIRLINGNQNSSKNLTKEFCAYLAKNHQPQREYNRACITSKIKELAKWQPCPEEGRMHKKLCWYVPIETRKRYGVSDLTFPNTWSYIFLSKGTNETGESEGDAKLGENKDTSKKDDNPEIINLSDDSNSCSLSETLTPELIKQASSKRTNYNIAKFIRPLTHDEKKKQFEPITLVRRPSEDQLNDFPSTSRVAEEKNNSAQAKIRQSKSSSEAPTTKKRVKVLMSGPVGQELSPKLKTTLVTQFLSGNLRKRKSTDVNDDATTVSSSTSTAGTSDGAKKSKLNSSVIVID